MQLTQAHVDALVAEHQQQLAIMAERVARHVLVIVELRRLLAEATSPKAE